MTRSLLNSFRARLIVLLAGAIILSEIVAVAIIVGDRGLAETFAFDSRIVTQAASAYGLASDATPAQQPEALRRVSTRDQMFSVRPQQPELPLGWLKSDSGLEDGFTRSLHDAGHVDVRVIVGSFTGMPAPGLIFPTIRGPAGSGQMPSGRAFPRQLPPVLSEAGQLAQEQTQAGTPASDQQPAAPSPSAPLVAGAARPDAFRRDLPRPDFSGQLPRFGPPSGDFSGAMPGPFPLTPGSRSGASDMGPGRGAWQDEGGYVLAAQLPNGSWLVSVARRPPSLWPLVQRASLAALIIAVVVLSIAAIIAGLIVRPINRLTAALAGFGRGEPHPDMRPEGPEDVRNAIGAFNTMSSNVSRIMSAQREMLAAVGHDLATPLTALRLKAELVGDPDLRTRMIDIIEEMQTLTQDVLTLARQATPLEKVHTIELGSLIDSLCQDLQDIGVPVSFEPGDTIVWRGRGNSMRRALRNVIENSAKYGETARVDLQKAGSSAIITIDDDGPGVPEAKLAEVLQPFVRLEQSRNRGTGGSGLGLPIAQTIIEAHGGSIKLSNRPEGGLRATIELPLLE